MSKIISVQDIRQSLATIANQASLGETFIVVRNSKPVFKIVPLNDEAIQKSPPSASLVDLTNRFDAARTSSDLSVSDLDTIIHEAHAEYRPK